MPAASSIILPVDTGNTGKQVRTQTRTVGGNTVHEQFFVGLRPGSESYRLCLFGATNTTIAAGTATAGHLFAFRWGSTTHAAKIQRVRVKRQVITGFTAAQELATALFRLTGYTASHTGGTAVTLTAPALKKDTGNTATRLTAAMISSGVALTAGTHTLDSQPIAVDSTSELAAAATVGKGFNLSTLEWDSVNNRELVLRQNEGLLVRNEILMGAGGVVRPIIEIDWEEVLLADVT
jgi:hypothetical protein